MKEIKLSDERKAQISERARREGGYFPWYFARKQNNHEIFLMLAEELKKRGCRVLCPNLNQDEKIEFIRVFKEGKGTIVGFGTVPFRWYIGNSVSGDEYGLVGKYGWDLPFDADEVIEKLHPIQLSKYDEYRFEHFHTEI